MFAVCLQCLVVFLMMCHVLSCSHMARGFASMSSIRHGTQVAGGLNTEAPKHLSTWGRSA